MLEIVEKNKNIIKICIEKSNALKRKLEYIAILFLSLCLISAKSNIFPFCIFVFICLISIFLCIFTISLNIFNGLHYIRSRKNSNIKKLHKRRNKNHQRHSSLNRHIEIAFLCDSAAFWTSFGDLYAILKDDSRFNVTLIAIPEIENQKVKNFDITKFFEENQLPYLLGYKNNHSKKLGRYQYDYIFPSRPYDHVRPSHMKNADLCKCAKLCHIPYGTCIFNGKTLETVCGFKHLQYYDFVFSETSDHTTIYNEKKSHYPFSDTKIIQVGSPKFDYIYYNSFASNSSYFDQVILYTPRWTMAEKACSFFDIYEKLFDLAENNPNIKYIFRPHPLMKKNFTEKIWSNDEWDNFVKRFKRLKNAHIDLNPSYLDSFREASVLISDMSSLLPEFLLTKKPVIYFHKKYQFNMFGKHISEGFYWCHSWSEVNNVLVNLRNGNDPKRNKRLEIIKDYFEFGEKTSIENIRDIILDDYNSQKLEK